MITLDTCPGQLDTAESTYMPKFWLTTTICAQDTESFLIPEGEKIEFDMFHYICILYTPAISVYMRQDRKF